MKKKSKMDINNHHGRQEREFTPASGKGFPTNPNVNDTGKITICHATGSEKNPYIEISVDANSLNGHGTHEGDIIPAPEEGCPTTSIDKLENKGLKKKNISRERE